MLLLLLLLLLLKLLPLPPPPPPPPPPALGPNGLPNSATQLLASLGNGCSFGAARACQIELFINSSLNLASHWDITFPLFRYVMNPWLLPDTQHTKLLNLKYEFGQSYFISYETDLRQLFKPTTQNMKPLVL
jgi:hypothetical protein